MNLILIKNTYLKIPARSERLRPSRLTFACALSPAFVLLGVWFHRVRSILENAVDIPDNTHGVSLSFAHATLKIKCFNIYI